MNYSLTSVVMLLLSLFLNSCSQPKKIFIGIAPSGEVSSTEIEIIRKSIEDYYKFTVLVLDKASFPDDNIFLQGDTVPTGYLWDYFNKLRKLHLNLYFMLGVTEKPILFLDILAGKEVKYIHRGFTQFQTAIISTYKIKAEARDEEQFYYYLSKVTLHETGHLLGLSHCLQSCKCFMIGVNDCATCDECLKIDNYDDMSKFYMTENKLCPSCEQSANKEIVALIEEIKEHERLKIPFKDKSEGDPRQTIAIKEGKE